MTSMRLPPSNARSRPSPDHVSDGDTGSATTVRARFDDNSYTWRPFVTNASALPSGAHAGDDPTRNALAIPRSPLPSGATSHRPSWSSFRPANAIASPAGDHEIAGRTVIAAV